MTDAFTTADAVLWSLAVALAAMALWLNGRAEVPWDPAAWFAAVLGVAWGGRAPVRGGAVPEEGWDGDPEELGETYAPARRLAPDTDWKAVGEWNAAVEAGIRRRLGDTRLVWLGEPSLTIPLVDTRVVPPGDDAAAAISAVCDRPELRLVLAAGEHADSLLRLLHAEPGLRDRVRAVLLVGARLDEAWIAENFGHLAFDVELSREVPYLTLRTAGATILPDPPEPPSARRSIAAIDLGEVEPEVLADPRCGRAVAALLAAVG